jgi:NAD(P)-dependent dehydrogenase (short-subunit alcohol dehydrogenase family)
MDLFRLWASPKGAMRIYSKAAAVRYGPMGVRVNTVHPGNMPPMLNEFYQVGRHFFEARPQHRTTRCR